MTKHDLLIIFLHIFSYVIWIIGAFYWGSFFRKRKDTQYYLRMIEEYECLLKEKDNKIKLLKDISQTLLDKIL